MDEINLKKRKRVYNKYWMQSKKKNEINEEFLESSDTDSQNDELSSDILDDSLVSSNDEENVLDIDEMIMQMDRNIDDIEINVDDDQGETDNSSDDEEETRVKLGKWTLKYGISQGATDELLKILKSVDGDTLSDLPMTARTLVKTPRSIDTEEKSGMQYKNLGLKRSLADNFRRYPEEVKATVDVIPLTVNVDGVSLFLSSKQWLGLCFAAYIWNRNVYFRYLLQLGLPSH